VVDDVLANVRLLEAKLTAEYFEVFTAMNGADALEIVQRSKPDIVLLDVVMPGMDGIEVCRRIKANHETEHIPVVMLTAFDRPEERVRGLEAGADDFLSNPAGDVALFCRVKSLVRLKMVTDELRLRKVIVDRRQNNAATMMKTDVEQGGNILFVDGDDELRKQIVEFAGTRHSIRTVSEPDRAISEALEGTYELAIVNLDLGKFDALRLCSQLRSVERTRHVPILVVADANHNERLMRALDMGVNDYLLRPLDKQEFLARVNTQIKRWRLAENLRSNVAQSIELAVTDALTGLYNRRFMERQLGSLLSEAANCGKLLSVLTLDIDHFKGVNDSHGHDAGDQVLRELAARMRQSIRNLDLPCRTGGEEFVVIVPNANAEEAMAIAERLRRKIGDQPFTAGKARSSLGITVSIGVAALQGLEDSLDALLKRADEALYRAKRTGRNRVDLAAA
jgi:two-component system cell cycle response regulator